MRVRIESLLSLIAWYLISLLDDLDTLLYVTQLFQVDLIYVMYNALCEYKNVEGELFTHTIHKNSLLILLMTTCYPT